MTSTSEFLKRSFLMGLEGRLQFDEGAVDQTQQVLQQVHDLEDHDDADGDGQAVAEGQEEQEDQPMAGTAACISLVVEAIYVVRLRAFEGCHVILENPSRVGD